METHRPEPQDMQAALMSGLLEGEDPDVYVVIPARTLTTQVELAVREATNTVGKCSPGRAAVRLIRNLDAIGYTKNTKRPGGVR